MPHTGTSNDVAGSGQAFQGVGPGSWASLEDGEVCKDDDLEMVKSAFVETAWPKSDTLMLIHNHRSQQQPGFRFHLVRPNVEITKKLDMLMMGVAPRSTCGFPKQRKQRGGIHRNVLARPSQAAMGDL